MNMLMNFASSHPAGVYFLGLAFLVALLLIFSLSIFYYIRAKDLAPYLRKIAQAKIDLADLEREVDGMRHEKENAKDMIERGEVAKKWLQDKSEEIKSTQKTIEDLHKEIQRLGDDKAAINQKISDLQQQQQDIENKRKKEEDKLAELEAQARVANSTILELKARRAESNEKWKNLDTPIIDEKYIRNVGATGIVEEDWLEKFSQRLAENGLIFDGRIVRAFHTSLKCAQQTPLVVLSGVSGTGKSLLPELYSAALGMNFLSVPVQPRWDSPQDLFGFYNYMEGRYKATELARLLWQFDCYNNEEARKKYGRRTLPLNLVLLDEMNLARVEYYFSDLLSKLETRNGLNAENQIERRKAEIELECNAAGAIDSMRHLFVSPHTLFVGTMNEDESTQMLSDKVIDRSNVLRFGRPKALGEGNGENSREPNKSGFIASYKDEVRIGAEEWDGWCKSLDQISMDDEGIKFLYRTVTPIIAALDSVNRAYGFRVDKAMKLYVSNYPDDYRNAVADQIEMKILPKLNGLDRQHENFERVQSVLGQAIAETKDVALAGAFEEACNPNAPFFKWRGVKR